MRNIVTSLIFLFSLNTLVFAQQHTLQAHLSTQITSLDPHKMETVSDGFVASQLFEGLVNLDSKGNIVEGVATHWEANSNYTRWIFHLRKEAKWSNNKPVTAKDFVYSWQRLANPKNHFPYSSYLSFMKIQGIDDILQGKTSPLALGVKAVDDFTLEIQLSHSIPYLADLLAHFSLYPIYCSSIEDTTLDCLKPESFVSNGAFVLSEQRVNEHIQLKNNPYYWNDKNNKIKSAKLWIVNNETALNCLEQVL